MDTILFALWFFLPAGFANAAPVFANKIPLINRWTTPIDLGFSYRGKRLLGPNKSWRGFCFGVLVAVITFLIQRWAYGQFGWVADIAQPVNYLTVSLWLGPLLGAGALIGDAVESFFKRQANVPSGEAWFPFDQIDYIIGGILLSSLVVTLSPLQNVTILLTWFGLHLIASYIGYLLHLKDAPI